MGRGAAARAARIVRGPGRGLATRLAGFCPDNTSRGCGGKEVLTTLHTVYQVASEKNQLVVDIFLPLAIAVFLKFLTAIIFAVKSRGTPFAPARVATDK